MVVVAAFFGFLVASGLAKMGLFVLGSKYSPPDWRGLMNDGPNKLSI
jgi:hypothetical protein